MTSKPQSLDQGIIKNFKILYRKEIVRSILSDIEEEKSTSITILQAIRLTDIVAKCISANNNQLF